jgi:hypothetical protein
MVRVLKIWDQRGTPEEKLKISPLFNKAFDWLTGITHIFFVKIDWPAEINLMFCIEIMHLLL